MSGCESEAERQDASRRDEQVQESIVSDERRMRANRTQGDRAVGGHLAISPTRITFDPHAFDRERGGEVWSALLADVVAVGKRRRTWNLSDGGIRTRLELEMRDGHSELFVVPRLDKVIAELNQLVSSRSRIQASG
jgi:hypothetical protein